MARPLLALGCLILSFGATRVLAAPEQATEPRTLEDVNHALSGRRADIVLRTRLGRCWSLRTRVDDRR